jgi:hypothetical protein
VLVAAFDRIARNVRHFLEVLDELNHLGIEFISLRESIDTSGPLGRAMVVIVGAIAIPCRISGRLISPASPVVFAFENVVDDRLHCGLSHRGLATPVQQWANESI